MASKPIYLQEKVEKLHGIAFNEKIKSISYELEIEPDWLMAVIDFESARTFQPYIQAPGNPNYVGLIQFGHLAAQDLNTTVEKLKRMSAIEQLDYVKRFYQMWKDRFSRIYKMPYRYKNAIELYTCTLYPAALGKPDHYALGSADNTIAQVAYGNRWFDLNKDGVVTYGEFKTYCRSNVFQNVSSDVLGVSPVNPKGFSLACSQSLQASGLFPTDILKAIDNLLNWLLSKGYISVTALA